MLSKKIKLIAGHIYTEKQMPEDFIKNCAAIGSCERAVNSYADLFEIENNEDVRTFLKNTGGWETEELIDKKQNKIRIVWLIACTIKESGEFYYD